MRFLGRVVGAAVCAVAVAGTSVAAAAPVPQPYRTSDAGGFLSILPPGTDGGANIGEILGFLAGGQRPQHNSDQLGMYAGLVKAPPGLRAADLTKFFVDGSFGVRDGQVERQYSPRADVTIQRDSRFGIAHVYGETREGTMFGAGYAQAEDRMFFMDVLRHAGRAALSGFAGGAPGNRAFERDIWELAPYKESEREAMFDALDDRFGADGAQAQRDVLAYCEGVNAFLRDAALDPLTLPGEYVALGKTPEPWKPADVVAIAGLINGVLGKGGGGELQWGTVLQTFQRRFGRKLGRQLWEGFRSAHDPEAPLTVRRGRFPYQSPQRRPRRDANVLPDPGTLEWHDLERDETGSAATAASRRAVERATAGDGMLAPLRHAQSNALLVSARESENGNPLAVFGPQASYFSPQIFHDLDLHGPGIDARGATVPGAGFYPVLARGRDYAWSATSAGQDIIDVFATPLCEPGGGTPTKASMGYELRGRCLPIEVLEQRNAWEPNIVDATPAGSLTYRSERTQLGFVTGRALVGGKPWVFTKLRSTYLHEADLAIAFLRITDPQRQRSFEDFRRNVDAIGASYNWFYADAGHIGYQMSGLMPYRAKRVDPLLPTSARFTWRFWDPATNDLGRRVGLDARPHVRDQAYITDWNNKQAAGFQGAENNTFSSVFRMQLLDDRVKRLTAGKARASLPELVEAMADAATVDLRGDKVLPWLLKVLGRQSDPALRDAMDTLRAWNASGAHRRDRDGDGRYDHADAVRIMDAWWPRLVRAIFEPKLGKGLYEQLLRTVELHDAPSKHQGSAFQTGWYGFVHKDLRAVLGRKVKGRYARRFCGNGRLSRCRTRLAASLREAAAVPAEELYGREADCEGAITDPQMCHDAILHTTAGGISQPPIPWQNRPTYQQAVEISRSVGR